VAATGPSPRMRLWSEGVTVLVTASSIVEAVRPPPKGRPRTP
jgi:hypothetical protein